MYAKKVYDFVFTLSLDNIPGVGSYNLLGDHHGPIKAVDLNRTRSLNRLDQSGRTYKDI
ncbi:CAP-Gly domain-containing linker protein 1, partial [Biomphalaria glabrata]